MPAKVFIDTNIVIYSLGPNSAKAVMAAPLFAERPTISTQVLSETANVALKKLARRENLWVARRWFSGYLPAG